MENGAIEVDPHRSFRWAGSPRSRWTVLHAEGDEGAHCLHVAEVFCLCVFLLLRYCVPNDCFTRCHAGGTLAETGRVPSGCANFG